MAIWTPPMHREATSLEHYIGNTLNTLGNFFYNTFHNTPSEYWLLNPQGQHNAIVLASTLSIALWLLYTHYSIRTTPTSPNTTPTPPSTPPPHPADHPHTPQRPPPPPYNTLFPPMQQLAPPGHLPPNAQPNASSVQLAQPLGPRAGRPASPGYRTGRPTSPGYQTPFKEQRGREKGVSAQPVGFGGVGSDGFHAMGVGRVATYRKLHGGGGGGGGVLRTLDEGER